MPDQQFNYKERSRIDSRKPGKYEVLIHNDDFTTMDIVVKILMEVFFKSYNEATTLMLKVHNSDKAVVGAYTFDIAWSKLHKATDMARREGFPLKLSIQPEN